MIYFFETTIKVFEIRKWNSKWLEFQVEIGKISHCNFEMSSSKWKPLERSFNWNWIVSNKATMSKKTKWHRLMWSANWNTLKFHTLQFTLDYYVFTYKSKCLHLSLALIPQLKSKQKHIAHRTLIISVYVNWQRIYSGCLPNFSLETHLFTCLWVR